MSEGVANVSRIRLYECTRALDWIWWCTSHQKILFISTL